MNPELTGGNDEVIYSNQAEDCPHSLPSRCLRQLCRLHLSPQEEAQDRDTRRGALQHQRLSGRQ